MKITDIHLFSGQRIKRPTWQLYATVVGGVLIDGDILYEVPRRFSIRGQEWRPTVADLEADDWEVV